MLSLVSHVQELKITSDFFRYEEFRLGLLKLLQSTVLNEIRSCSLCMDLVPARYADISVIREWAEVSLIPFALPRIETISTVLGTLPCAPNGMQTSAVSRLEFYHYQDRASDLAGLLGALPNLRHLTYTAQVEHEYVKSSYVRDERTHRSLGLAPLFRALHLVRRTLETLILSQNFTEDTQSYEQNINWYGPVYQPVRALHDLPHLRQLTIPFCTLLGWNSSPVVLYDWTEILPPSIRSVTWTDDFYDSTDEPYCWVDTELMAPISGFLKWLAAIPRSPQPVAFGLRINQMLDFDKPAQQRVKDIALQYGVECTIVKTSWVWDLDSKFADA